MPKQAAAETGHPSTAIGPAGSAAPPPETGHAAGLRGQPGNRPSNGRIRIVAAHRYPITGQRLVRLLRHERDLSVVAMCHDGDETLSSVRALAPDLLLLGGHLPGKDGLIVLRELRDAGLATRALFVTAPFRDDELLEAIRLDVGGVIPVETTAEELSRCIRRVHAGERWLSRGQVFGMLEQMLRREAGLREVGAILTPREMQIVGQVVKGLTNGQVAAQLFVSEGTIKVHLHNVYAKLRVGGRSELSSYFRELGLT